jgi:hypothetical protein
MYMKKKKEFDEQALRGNGLPKRFLTSIRKDNHTMFSFPKIRLLLALFLTVTLLGMPELSMAFPIPVNAEISWESKDESLISIKGPYKYKAKKKNKKTGEISELEIDIGPGGTFTLKDKKTKGGKIKPIGIDGDPLAYIEGNILSGSGTYELVSSGIPELFSSTTIDLSFITGTVEMAVTLPGDQLTGPDGNDTFISWESTWSSLYPIGTFNDGTDDFDIILGEFNLDSVGHPLKFWYDLNPDLTGTMTFTVGQMLDTGLGQPLFGVVTKELTFTPEPSTVLLLGLGGLALVRRRRK